jgi:hypothetical protein
MWQALAVDLDSRNTYGKGRGWYKLNNPKEINRKY